MVGGSFHAINEAFFWDFVMGICSVKMKYFYGYLILL